MGKKNEEGERRQKGFILALWPNWLVVELWGVKVWAGKDSETALCHWKCPMEKFLWHFVWRGGQLQSARAEALSRNLGEGDDAYGASPRVWAGLNLLAAPAVPSQLFTLFKLMGVDGLTQNLMLKYTSESS